MLPGVDGEPFVFGRQQVKQCELAVSMEDFILQLNVKQCRSCDPSGIALDTLRRGQGGMHGSALLKAKLAEDHATKATTHRRHHRQAKSCSHGHSEVGKLLWIGEAQVGYDPDRRPPVEGHTVENRPQASSGDARLVLGGRQRRRHSFAMKWAVNSHRGNTGLRHEPPSRHKQTVASLVSAAAMTQQNQRSRTGRPDRQPENARYSPVSPLNAEGALGDTVADPRFAPFDGCVRIVVHSASIEQMFDRLI